jgi:hypothetical protein
MFAEKPKRKLIPESVKRKVFDRSKGKCENPRCSTLLRWNDKGKGTVKGKFHHVGDPCKTPTSRTVRFLCPNCHDSFAHEFRTVKKRDPFWGTETKKIKVIRKPFVKIGHRKKVETKMVSYTCKRSVNDRAVYCGKKKADKSCLKYRLAGTKCQYLMRRIEKGIG